MSNIKPTKYYLVDAEMLPEVFLKVMEAKELLQTGEADTVAEAVAMAGISRSAFYKYKDSISPFQDLKRGHILTFHVLVRDQAGSLSTVLGIFAQCGANILTINQTIPTNGCAGVTISAETSEMSEDLDAMIARVGAADGVLKFEILAG